MPTPIWTSSFATKALSNFTRLQTPSPDRLRVIDDPLGQKGKVLAATVQPGDFVADTNGSRAEVMLSVLGDRDYMFYAGQERWIRFSILLSQDFRSDARWHCIHQQHQMLDYGMGFPPVQMTLHGETLSWVIMDQYLWQTPVVRGKWLNFLSHFKFSKGADGLTELWLEDKLVSRQQGPNMDSDGLNYPKFGLYRHRDIAVTQTVIHSDNEIYAEDPRVVAAPPVVQQPAPVVVAPAQPAPVPIPESPTVEVSVTASAFYKAVVNAMIKFLQVLGFSITKKK